MLAIPADSDNADAAHKFINFLLKPEIIADITNYVAYANANVTAFDKVDPSISSNTSIYPDEKVKARLFTQELRKDKLNKLLTRLWTQIKTGR
jgi:putrescine transport system substrate-binding protein